MNAVLKRHLEEYAGVRRRQSEAIERPLGSSRMAGTGRGFVLSAQVLGEFFVTVTRELARPLSIGRARQAVGWLSEFPVQPITAALVDAAIARVERSKLSYWDALIVETSRAAGSDVLLTEDLQNGQVLGTGTTKGFSSRTRGSVVAV